jgi:hypothetical protein
MYLCEKRPTTPKPSNIGRPMILPQGMPHKKVIQFGKTTSNSVTIFQFSKPHALNSMVNLKFID